MPLFGFLLFQCKLIQQVLAHPGNFRSQRRRPLEWQLGQQQVEHPLRLGTDRLLALRRTSATDQHHALAALLVAVAGNERAQLGQGQALEGLEGLGQFTRQ